MNRYFYFLLAMGITITSMLFTSCGDDNEDIPNAPTSVSGTLKINGISYPLDPYNDFEPYGFYMDIKDDSLVDSNAILEFIIDIDYSMGRGAMIRCNEGDIITPGKISFGHPYKYVEYEMIEGKITLDKKESLTSNPKKPWMLKLTLKFDNVRLRVLNNAANLEMWNKLIQDTNFKNVTQNKEEMTITGTAEFKCTDVWGSHTTAEDWEDWED